MQSNTAPVYEAHTYVKDTLLSRKPRKENTIIAFIAVGVLVLLSVVSWSGLWGLAPWLSASREQVFAAGEYWRLFTALGVHGDIGHLLSNALGFGLFAYLLYDYFGFSVFPAAAVVLGALVHALTLMTYKPEVRLIGASGMVYLMVGFWLVQYLLIERRLKLSNRAIRCMGFALAAMMPSTFEQTVSYRAHAIGFAVGAVFGLIYFVLHRKRIRSHETTATELVEVDPPAEHPATEEALDELERKLDMALDPNVDPDLEPIDDPLDTDDEPGRAPRRRTRGPRGGGTV
ncbi:MAG TPA: rhomboid family intramembrane serine protease [Bdellovibrionales bacterium]|nr:rhomboid family intramembrane serine protease [Bdellovibrionales bacterium]